MKNVAFTYELLFLYNILLTMYLCTFLYNTLHRLSVFNGDLITYELKPKMLICYLYIIVKLMCEISTNFVRESL